MLKPDLVLFAVVSELVYDPLVTPFCSGVISAFADKLSSNKYLTFLSENSINRTLVLRGFNRVFIFSLLLVFI